jgi:hypothetical protein
MFKFLLASFEGSGLPFTSLFHPFCELESSGMSSFDGKDGITYQECEDKRILGAWTELLIQPE